MPRTAAFEVLSVRLVGGLIGGFLLVSLGFDRATCRAGTVGVVAEAICVVAAGFSGAAVFGGVAGFSGAAVLGGITAVSRTAAFCGAAGFGCATSCLDTSGFAGDWMLGMKKRGQSAISLVQLNHTMAAVMYSIWALKTEAVASPFRTLSV